MRPPVVALFLIAIAAAVFPDLGWAQQTSTMPDLRRGQNVWLTLTDGSEHRGRVSSVSATTIELIRSTGAAPMPVSRDTVLRVDISDTVLDGTFKGMRLGLFAGIPVFVHELNARGEDAPLLAPYYGLIGSGIGAGAGAMVGAVLDYLHQHRETIYQAQPSSLTIAPIVSRRVVGIGATIRW